MSGAPIIVTGIIDVRVKSMPAHVVSDALLLSAAKQGAAPDLTLVDAVVRCKEMNVAKPLAHEVKVPFPGKRRQDNVVYYSIMAAVYRGSPSVDSI